MLNDLPVGNLPTGMPLISNWCKKNPSLSDLLTKPFHPIWSRLVSFLFFFFAFLSTSTLSLSRVHEKHTFLPVQRKVYRVNKLQTDRTSTAVSSEILSIGTRPYFRKPFVALNDKKERLGQTGCSRILSENASQHAHTDVTNVLTS